MGLGVYVSDEVLFESCCGRVRARPEGLGEALGVPYEEQVYVPVWVSCCGCVLSHSVGFWGMNLKALLGIVARSLQLAGHVSVHLR
jgi:hypothetical protein